MNQSYRFQRPDILRPPSEWDSYYLPLTRGCSNNTCTFCSFYGSKLQIRDINEVKAEIDALYLYMKHGVRTTGMPGIVYAIAREWDGRKVFLQDGDALAYPLPKLLEALDYLNYKFPDIKRIASYATPQDILRRTPDELKQLKTRKLGILYMGIESGDNDVLRATGKGVTREQIVQAGRMVKDSGITLSVTVILGLAGVEGSERHSHETARVLTEVDPDFAGALTLILVPGTPMYRQAEMGSFRTITPLQSLEELRVIVSESSFSNSFFSSMHASNYLSIRGRLPADKNRLLKQLDEVCARKDPSLLRPEFMRAL
ncbi:MAG: radical SAM protein [Candidatus Hadarchaeum sp.]